MAGTEDAFAAGCASASASLAHLTDEEIDRAVFAWDAEWDEAMSATPAEWKCVACDRSCACGGAGWVLRLGTTTKLHFSEYCACLRKVHRNGLPKQCAMRHEALGIGIGLGLDQNLPFRACDLIACPCGGEGHVSLASWSARHANSPSVYRLHVWARCPCDTKTHLVTVQNDACTAATIRKCVSNNV